VAATKKKASKKKASKKSSSRAVATRRNTLPEDWREQLRKDAQEESERTPAGSGNRISLKRNGKFAFQGAELGSSIQCVIVDHIIAKTWYDRPFDEDDPSPPACFALKPDPKNIAPHASSPLRQAEVCEDCWANEWASSTRGKGKACSDKHRLALLHADDLDGDLIYLEVPVTSGAAFKKYITGVTKAADLPCYAVLTEISMDDHADWQTLNFELIGEVSENDLAAPFSKRKQAREMLMTPYDVTGFVPAEGKKGGKKKVAGKKKASSKKKATRRSRMS
jgi:hypothetical protein